MTGRPGDALRVAADIIAFRFPNPDAHPGPCANCGHTAHNMSGGHERGKGRCHGGLDPCPVRCQQYVRPEPLLAQRLRRLADDLDVGSLTGLPVSAMVHSPQVGRN